VVLEHEIADVKGTLKAETQLGKRKTQARLLSTQGVGVLHLTSSFSILYLACLVIAYSALRLIWGRRMSRTRPQLPCIYLIFQSYILLSDANGGTITGKAALELHKILACRQSLLPSEIHS